MGVTPNAQAHVFINVLILLRESNVFSLHGFGYQPEASKVSSPTWSPSKADICVRTHSSLPALCVRHWPPHRFGHVAFLKLILYCDCVGSIRLSVDFIASLCFRFAKRSLMMHRPAPNFDSLSLALLHYPGFVHPDLSHLPITPYHSRTNFNYTGYNT